MFSKKLKNEHDAAIKKHSHLTTENFYRIMLLTHGVNYKNLDSYPDAFTRLEVIFSVGRLSSIEFLTLFKPTSPFTILEAGGNKQVLLYKNEFVDEVIGFESTTYNLKNDEPFYFFVKEVNGDLVLKLNPIQLCDFFQNSGGLLPCEFCFRNDMVNRFKNISPEDLVSLIIENEKANGYKHLKIIDELSMITGSYTSDEDYIVATEKILKGLKPFIPVNSIITFGSHEGKFKENFKRLKKAGVNRYAFPLEMLTDEQRKTRMKNRKGVIKMTQILEDIENAVDVFGEDRVIVRVIAGMGDALDDTFRETVKKIAGLGKNKGPMWNVNIYMPFTHYHWRMFDTKRPFTTEYLFEYMSILNEYIPQERFIPFKISP